MIRHSLASVLVVVLGCGTSASDDPLANPPAFPELASLDTTPDPTCSGEWVAAITGRVIDSRGFGVPAARPQTCVRVPGDGSVRCLMPPTADAEGWFVSLIEGDNRCMSEVAMRALLPDSRYGTSYSHIDLRPVDGVLHMDRAIALFELDPPATLPPEGDATSSRTVVFDDGLELDVVPDVLFGEYGELRARRLSQSEFPDFAREAGLLGLYAFAPEYRTGESGFAMRIPNNHGLADGDRLELLILGGLDTVLPDGRHVEEADFEVYGTATVSGNMIVTDAGSELPYLSMVGYRR